MLCAFKKSKHIESNETDLSNSRPYNSINDVYSIYSISLLHVMCQHVFEKVDRLVVSKLALYSKNLILDSTELKNCLVKNRSKGRNTVRANQCDQVLKLKGVQIFHKVAPKVATAVFTLK